ncbi:lasso peptide biosynthesis PqqD family chaperone [Streptomyces sp. NPDC013187]|uniref:lasso peptide biosynthesis PqqD family chaperone n=1 Tax=Streptomyces sp. NPDC013187 TaxID=3364865 RepID=UPI0036A6EA71
MAFKLREGVFTAETDFGMTLLDEDHDQYWTLNPSAAVAFRTLLEGGSEADAAQRLTQEYAVDIGTARQDVRDLVGGLHSAGLGGEDTGGPEESTARGRWPHLRGRRAGRKRR